MFVEIVFPQPFKNSFTYSVPEELEELARIGVRAVAPFSKRVMTGFIIAVSDTTDVKTEIRPIHDILDRDPIFTEESLSFYRWIAEYYVSSLGEALKNSVPFGLEVETKKKIVPDMEFCLALYQKEEKKNSLKARLLKALSEKEIYSIINLQRAAGRKNIYAHLRALEKLGAISIVDELQKAKVGIKKLRFVKLAKATDDIFPLLDDLEKKSPVQLKILLELISRKEEVALSELLKKTKASQASVEGLANKGLIEVFDKEVTRSYLESYEEEKKEITLTSQQQSIVDEVSEPLCKSAFQPYLLFGVTGSGKTQVYIELTRLALKEGKSVLILVPEISLTPQITARLYNNFGETVSVIHSRMSYGERYDTWRNIVSGRHRVVIGPRSALFAPLKNIGLIVVDEEHDGSYKQYENVPKYQARDAAVIKARMNNCPVILGSATPSIESMYNALSGKYKLLELKERVDDAQLPEIKLINVAVEKKKKLMESVFSKPVLTEIASRIEKKEGVIILQNRRGFATQVYCEDCGELETCSDCSVPLVFHINRNILQCHYCGFVKPVPNACTKCGSVKIKYFGTGTQRVEDELSYYFPDARIERIDSDSISQKGALGIIMNNFRRGEIDILVGTQMVSKGLDFPNVTLVGVVAAETTLWLPDFRADERTFQLLTQVSGRAGRSRNAGEVLIQTQNHKHFVLQMVLMNDYTGFYEKEILLRQSAGYPPFSRLCLIESKDEDEQAARGAIEEFFQYLQKYRSSLRITPPSEAIIAKLKKNYRFHILIKSDKKLDPGGAVLRNAVANAFVEFNRTSRFRNVRLIFDIDPQSII